MRSDPQMAILVTSSDLEQGPPVCHILALCEVVTECLHARGFSQAPLTKGPLGEFGGREVAIPTLTLFPWLFTSPHRTLVRIRKRHLFSAARCPPATL